MESETQFVTAGSLLYSVEHRPWPPPDAQWLFSQSWNDVLLAHFAIDPPELRRLVPQALTLELYDGAAWLTISPFYTSYLRPSGVPPLPGLSFFPQVTVRTYVTVADRPGLFYFSVDAASRSAVWLQRMLLRMPCWPAKIAMSGRAVASNRDGKSSSKVQSAEPASSSAEVSSGPRGSFERAIGFRLRRLRGPAALSGPAIFEAAYVAAGEAAPARRYSLDEFLVERYCAYSWNGRRLYRSELHHQPWLLQRATVEIVANSLAEPLGLALPAEAELCHFARCNKMLAWAPERMRLRR